VFASGLVHGQVLLQLTLTAPGDDLHFRADGQPCMCTPAGGINVAEFNANIGTYFNRFITSVRRTIGHVAYAQAAEVQDGKRREDGCGRGALHKHITLRCSPRTAALLLSMWDERDPDCALRVLAMRMGFGHSMKLDVQPAEERARVRWAGYCAKYAAKSCDDRNSMPWLNKATGEVEDGQARYRTWSASRDWGLRMCEVKQLQREWNWAGGAPTEGAHAGALDPNPHRYATTRRMENA
jgi:hypothetical protein